MMRWIGVAAVLFAMFGCGSKPNPFEDAVPCNFTLLAIDGTPLPDQVRVADDDGMVRVFVEIEVASIAFDDIDFAGRSIHEPKFWQLDLCMVDRNSESEKLKPVAGLMYDDPAISEMYPEQFRDLISESARPEGFRSEKPGFARYFGSVNIRGIRGITGRREFVLRLFPTADKMRAIPISRSMGVPVPLQYFHAELQPEGKD